MKEKQNKRKVSIRYKILLPTALVIIAISTFMGVSSYRSIKQGMVSMGVEEAEMAARAAVTIVDGELLGRLLPGDEDTEEYQSQLAAMRRIQKEYGIAFLYTLYTDGETVFYGIDTDETDEQMQIGEAFEVSYEELAGVFSGIKYAQDYIDYTEHDGELISVYFPIKDSSGKVVAVLGSDYDAVNVVEKLNTTIYRTITAAVLCTIIALVLINFIVQGIMKSLLIVDKKVYDLVHSDGDLTKQLDVHTGDELEVIADNLNMVLGHICDQANIARKVADGNLTVKVYPMSQNDLLGNALKQLVERNRRALRGISEAAVQAKTGASQMADASETLAQGSTEQAGVIEQITASINGVANQTRKNAQDAEQAAALLVQAIERVNSGNAHMHEMAAAMEDINQSAQSISKIIHVIDDIAFQTNILALNASVEASRAGEAGREFAVVAGEIRNLANKCAAAASETSSLIEDSLNSTKMGAAMADKMADALNAITEVVEQSGKMVQEIATASGEQNVAIAEIDKAVEQISHVVQTNSASSEECAASSAGLLTQMDVVARMLSAFRLE